MTDSSHYPATGLIRIIDPAKEPKPLTDIAPDALDDEQRAKTLHITDRREAIRAAAAMARPGDVILVAGKGHEPYQEIEGVKHHFDDHEEVRAAFGC